MTDFLQFNDRVRFTEDFYEWYDWDDKPQLVMQAAERRVCTVEGRAFTGGNSEENIWAYLVVYRTDGFEECWWVPGHLLERV